MNFKVLFIITMFFMVQQNYSQIFEIKSPNENIQLKVNVNGAMTDWTPRKLEMDLSFLKEGSFKMEVFKDGANVDRFAEDYKIDVIEVNQNSKITAEISAGGGWAAIVTIQSVD